MANSADIKYTPRKDGSYYEAISASSVIAGVLAMLKDERVIGDVDIFGEAMTTELAAAEIALTRSRAAEILRRVADELDAANK